MDTWTLQTGYPVVTFERNYDNDSFTIRQVNFLNTYELLLLGKFQIDLGTIHFTRGL